MYACTASQLCTAHLKPPSNVSSPRVRKTFHVCILGTQCRAWLTADVQWQTVCCHLNDPHTVKTSPAVSFHSCPGMFGQFLSLNSFSLMLSSLDTGCLMRGLRFLYIFLLKYYGSNPGPWASEASTPQPHYILYLCISCPEIRETSRVCVS